MARVEAVVFASPHPVPRDVLGRLVGRDCRLDELLGNIRDELRGRPYEIAVVAGGWHIRTRPSVADAIRASGVAAPSRHELSEYEATILMTIAYLQPITRAELSRFVGRQVSRDTIAALRRPELIGAGPRAPLPGAPATYVTTTGFLSTYGFNTLRDLPDVEALEDAGLLVIDERLGEGPTIFPPDDDDDDASSDDDQPL